MEHQIQAILVAIGDGTVIWRASIFSFPRAHITLEQEETTQKGEGLVEGELTLHLYLNVLYHFVLLGCRKQSGLRTQTGS